MKQLEQQAFENCVKSLDGLEIESFVRRIFKQVKDLELTIDPRAVSMTLLNSDVHKSMFFDYYELLALRPEEISVTIEQCLERGYIEAVLRNLHKIKGLNEEALIRKMLSHKEDQLNAWKIVAHHKQFHLPKETIGTLFSEYLKKYTEEGWTDLSLLLDSLVDPRFG